MQKDSRPDPVAPAWVSPGADPFVDRLGKVLSALRQLLSFSHIGSTSNTLLQKLVSFHSEGQDGRMQGAGRKRALHRKVLCLCINAWLAEQGAGGGPMVLCPCVLKKVKVWGR